MLTVFHFRKNRTCRICTKRSNFVINIFDGPSESGLSNVDVVSHYTGLDVQRGDSLPETVCSLCLVDARIAFRSKPSCPESDQLDIRATEDNLDELGANTEKEILKIAELCDESAIKKEALEIPEYQVKQERLEDSECILPDYSRTTPFQIKEEQIECELLHDEVSSSYSNTLYDEVIRQTDSKTTFLGDSRTHESFSARNTLTSQGMPHKADTSFKYQKRSARKIFFRCSFCMKCFKQQSDLDLHMLSHSGERFSCSVCSESFAFNNDLQRHMRTHNTNLIKCPKCPRLFQHKTGLKNHLLKHGFKFHSP
ncbi:zinc finger protein Xfin-like isoform X2 [Drosophila erecta]|uniref:zinc finger protein Xfin-like isoform X2 n=1 Tax=Drosophila erecta TaxID=7220 RepID=UPI000F054597|nr:zinc finger protein Xfin-like isoform X2 [Drosophila erecta]